MRTYASLGVFLLSLLGTLDAHSVGWSSDREQDACPRSEGIQRIQAACSEPNNALLNAESEKDHKEVCAQFVKILFCGAEHIPECFDLVEEILTQYRHSPFNCQPSTAETLQLQKLFNKNISKKQPTSGETTPDSAPQPWTHGQGGGANGEEGGDNQDGYDIKTGSGEDKATDKDTVSIGGSPSEHTHDTVPGSDRDDKATDEHELGNKGTRGEQKGSDNNDKDGGRHLASWSVWVLLVLAMASGRLPWRLMS